jgi:hypothetical protein
MPFRLVFLPFIATSFPDTDGCFGGQGIPHNFCSSTNYTVTLRVLSSRRSLLLEELHNVTIQNLSHTSRSRVVLFWLYMTCSTLHIQRAFPFTLVAIHCHGALSPNVIPFIPPTICPTMQSNDILMDLLVIGRFRVVVV